MPGPRVCVWSRGVSGPGGAWWRPPPTATAAGGTHPTGMHSCGLISLPNLYSDTDSDSDSKPDGYIVLREHV